MSPKTFGQRLKERMEELGLSGYALLPRAWVLGKSGERESLDHGLFYKILNDQQPPGRKSLLQLSAALGTPVQELELWKAADKLAGDDSERMADLVLRMVKEWPAARQQWFRAQIPGGEGPVSPPPKRARREGAEPSQDP